MMDAKKAAELRERAHETATTLTRCKRKVRDYRAAVERWEDRAASDAPEDRLSSTQRDQFKKDRGKLQEWARELEAAQTDYNRTEAEVRGAWA